MGDRRQSAILQTTIAFEEAKAEMTQKQVKCHLSLRVLLIIGAIATFPLSAMAQRVPIADDTLGDERSIVSPDEVIRGVPSNRIDGGARRGANLFHSFREFNIDEGRGAYFTNPDGVANILTRVTGGSRSDILGTLGILGNANLFLINPNGILFGQNARLDVAGSFISSTANGFVFDNEFTFSASDPQAPPLLTVSAPIGLQYGRTPGTIQVERASLQIPDGQTLTLAGGTVNIIGNPNRYGFPFETLVAPGGRVELAGLADAGEVGLTQQGQEWQLSLPERLARADVAISNDAVVNVRASGGGSIAISARNFTSTGFRTTMVGGIARGLGIVGAQAGDIEINATDFVNINASLLLNAIQSGSTGKAGNIEINAGAFTLTNGAQVSAITEGQGDAGNITITARDRVTIDGTSDNGSGTALFTSVNRGAVGQGGDIRITTGTLSLINGGQVTASTRRENTSLRGGQGNAGNITIMARDSVSIDGRNPNGFSSSILSSIETGAIGQGGDISITTGTLSLSDGGGVEVSTFGQGDAGNVSITARDAVSFDGGFASSSVRRGAVGQGGDISITTGSLSLTNRTQVGSATFGQGNAGNLTITATDKVSLDESGAFSQVAPGGIGQGGIINIITGSLSLTNGAILNTNTYGQGDAGNISITARDRVSFDGVGSEGISSAAFSQVDSQGIGRGGNISITTATLSVTNGGEVTTSTFGRGDAGNITITASDVVSFDGIGSNGFASGVASSVQPGVIGRAGGINITANSLSLTNGGFVSASTSGQGNAGDITIAASDSVSFDGIGSNGVPSGAFSTVESEAIGRGGNIRITAGDLSLSNGARVSAATSGRGRAGNITFNAPTFTVTGNAQVLAATTSTGDGGSIVVNAPGSVNLRRSNNLSPVLSVETSGAGQAGDITLNTPSLTLAERARITATATDTATNPQGGGSVTLNASTLNLAGIVGVFAETQGQAPAGTLQLNPYRNQPDLEIALTPRSQISASTSGSGRGGDLIVTAPRSITIAGSGQLAVETRGVGDAGNMNFTTQQLSLTDGVELSASTSGTGQAGDIDINAERFTLSDGAQVSTNTSSRGTAGDLTVQVTDQLFLTGRGTGLFASTTPGSTGDGGNIAIDPRQVQIEDGATIAVDSQGRGIGGNISLQADQLILNRRGSITAETDSTQGGNITLQVPDLLLLRDRSRISTTAGTARAGGNGGNISFDGQFIVAAPNENSDISANAFTGRGGNVEINAQSIFGIQPRSQPTIESDITASSERGVAGVVSINTPDVDPSRGLVQLPIDLTDASRLIAQACPTGSAARQANQFIITGRGGLPPTPNEAVNRDAIQVDLVTADPEDESSVSQQESTPNHSPSESSIAEAQGWQIVADGKVMLVAAAPESAIGWESDRLIECR
jgi:filamentous hemagglutinin family protein